MKKVLLSLICCFACVVLFAQSYQKITYKGRTYTPQEVEKMFEAISAWGESHLVPSDKKLFRQGLENLKKQNAAGHIFIPGNDPDYNRRGKFGADAKDIPGRLLLELLEQDAATTAKKTTTTTTAKTSSEPKEVGRIDPMREFLMVNYFGGNFQQYKADLNSNNKVYSKEKRLAQLREGLKFIMRSRNLSTQYVDSLSEDELWEQMSKLGINVVEAKQYYHGTDPDGYYYHEINITNSNK